MAWCCTWNPLRKSMEANHDHDRLRPGPAAAHTAGQRNQGAARIRARRGVPARPLLEGEGPGPDHPDSRGAADGADRLAHDCHGRAGAGRDLARQRVGQGQCGGVLPRRRSAEGHHQRRALLRGHQPTLADHAAFGAGQARAGREAGRARQAQHGYPADPRRPDRRLGHQGRQRRDQAHRPQRDHGPRHRQAGRGRARAPGQGDPCRRRATGGREGGAGGQAARRRPACDPVALPADADRECRGEGFHDPVPAADGAGRIVPGAGRKRKGLSKRSISRRACGSRPAAPPTAAAGCRAAGRTASPSARDRTTSAARAWCGSAARRPPRSEEHTSELQSLMRTSYAVFWLKKKKYAINTGPAHARTAVHYGTHFTSNSSKYKSTTIMPALYNHPCTYQTLMIVSYTRKSLYTYQLYTVTTPAVGYYTN